MGQMESAAVGWCDDAVRPSLPTRYQAAARAVDEATQADEEAERQMLYCEIEVEEAIAEAEAEAELLAEIAAQEAEIAAVWLSPLLLLHFSCFVCLVLSWGFRVYGAALDLQGGQQTCPC